MIVHFRLTTALQHCPFLQQADHPQFASMNVSISGGRTVSSAHYANCTGKRFGVIPKLFSSSVLEQDPYLGVVFTGTSY